jgi:hypothetical protein
MRQTSALNMTRAMRPARSLLQQARRRPGNNDNETSAPAARRGVEALEHLKPRRASVAQRRLAVSRGERPGVVA